MAMQANMKRQEERMSIKMSEAKKGLLGGRMITNLLTGLRGDSAFIAADADNLDATTDSQEQSDNI